MHPPSSPATLVVAARSVVTAAGIGTAALHQALREHRCALSPNTTSSRPLETFVGQVAPVDQAVLPTALRPLDCRNNRLAWLALQADGLQASVERAVARFGAARVGLALGTSTSTIGATEAVYRALARPEGSLPHEAAERRLHTLHATGLFVQQAMGLSGPAVTVSTACSSSAKVFGVAARWLALGMADAVLVGGVDSLCDSVLFGFQALQLVSRRPCRPFDRQRDGLSLGEAAGFALLTRHAGLGQDSARLCGVGESSDAHHMSAPHPEGRGAAEAMSAALRQAGLPPAAIDYLNLHGTATLRNDEVEARQVGQLFNGQLHGSSTKGCTGHTLGAAGIVEAIVCVLAIETGLRPGTVGLATPDPAAGPWLRREPSEAAVGHAMSNSFGFGGSNCALVFGAMR